MGIMIKLILAAAVAANTDPFKEASENWYIRHYGYRRHRYLYRYYSYHYRRYLPQEAERSELWKRWMRRAVSWGYRHRKKIHSALKWGQRTHRNLRNRFNKWHHKKFVEP